MHTLRNCAKLRFRFTALALATTLSFAGCGGGSSGAADSGSPSSSTATSAADGDTGSAANLPGSASAMEDSNSSMLTDADALAAKNEIDAAARTVVAGQSTPEAQALALKGSSRSNMALDSLIKLIVSAMVAMTPNGPATAATSPSTAVSPSAAPISQMDAARFLVQATYGPNMGEITDLAKIGYDAWLTRQFDTPPMDTHWAYVVDRKGPINCDPCDAEWINATMESFWYQAVLGPDQLRQRMALALDEIFVTSAYNSSIEIYKEANSAYYDMLTRNAFGNFRTLLEQVATHPTMGIYLSSLKNEKEDPVTGRLPDENFAREVMQLFTIGLWQLNPDGTRKKDSSGNPIPTYSQADVMGMAKVFTGWSWGSGHYEAGYMMPPPAYDQYARSWNMQMRNYPDHHSTSEKRIINGVVIPANTSGEATLKIALDTLFNHPNVGPFIGSQLIQRFVTSAPSPAYVARVTAVFNNNGKGVRGDMKALIRAILLDPEARSAASLTDSTFGKLREPIVRYANFMRAFNDRPASNRYKIWNTEDTVQGLGQNPMRAPSVFNWYRPSYAPPGPIADRGLTAPEFQITDETTITGYSNFIQHTAEQNSAWWFENNKSWMGASGRDQTVTDYSAELALASDPTALVARLNLLLAAGQLSTSTARTVAGAVANSPMDRGGLTRVITAITLIMLSPEYMVQK